LVNLELKILIERPTQRKIMGKQAFDQLD